MATVDEPTATATASPPVSGESPVTEAIRQYFRNDGSRMTMMAARKFRVPERFVLDALVGEWPITRLRHDAFHGLLRALGDLGPMRVFVRSNAAVIETVGTFGGLSESGPFFNVQTDTLDMHILPEEIATIFAVEKTGHDSNLTTYSFQFFDRSGDAAFKAFVWDEYPRVPSHRIESFRAIAQRLRALPGEPATEAAPALRSPSGLPLPLPLPDPAPLISGQEPDPPVASDSESDQETESDAPKVAIPIPEGVVPGTSMVASLILGESKVAEAPRIKDSPPTVLLRKASRALGALALLVVLYLMMVTFVTPIFWRHYEHHFKLSEAPSHALSEQNQPSDPLNVGLIGADWELIRVLVLAGWRPADPVTFRTGLKYDKDSLKTMAYPSATLSDLYLFGRRQDLMFEKESPKGKTGRRALRLWKSPELGMGGQPLWIGSVGLDLGPAPVAKGSDRGSHRIAPDLDAERDALIADLNQSLRLTEIFHVTGAGPTLSSRNDKGQSYFTDGEMAVGVISRTPRDRIATRLASPWGVRFKDQAFNELRPMLRDFLAE